MSIEYAILGLLSWKPLSGYDLKKMISESDVFYWSGNNNQIYKSLLALHKAGMVTQEVLQQESLPAKKLYHITEKGRTALREWVLSTPELPEMRSIFLVQLAWADMLSPGALDALLAQYETELAGQVLMSDATADAKILAAPDRTPRERFLWEQITRRQADALRGEMEWVRRLREEHRKRFMG